MALAVHTKQILSSSGSDGELAETRAVLDFMQEKNRGGMQVNIAAQFVSRRVPFRAARKPYQAAKNAIQSMIRKGIIETILDDTGKTCIKI